MNPYTYGINQYQNDMMAMAEKVRNKCADICDLIALQHFAQDLAWSMEGVDPLEIAHEKGASDCGFECVKAINNIDCFDMLSGEFTVDIKNTLKAHQAIFDALFDVFPECRCIGDLPGHAKFLKEELEIEKDARIMAIDRAAMKDAP